MDNYLISSILEFLTIDENHIRQYFKNTIFDKKIILNLPILTYKDRFSLGDYIDNIRNSDLKYPIMIGVDDWNRPFITFKASSQKIMQ